MTGRNAGSVAPRISPALKSDTDAQLADLADLIFSVARELGTRRTYVNVEPVTGTEVLVMRLIDRTPGATPSALAVASALTRSNLSAALRSLEAKGLVQTSRDQNDRRAVRVYPTDYASANLKTLRSQWSAHLRDALSGETAGLADVIAFLQALDDRLSELSTRPGLTTNSNPAASRQPRRGDGQQQRRTSQRPSRSG